MLMFVSMRQMEEEDKAGDVEGCEDGATGKGLLHFPFEQWYGLRSFYKI